YHILRRLCEGPI
nr:immunoglobulin heavy chain junction region [Homo sapiens]